MGKSLNQVLLIGNLTKEPELRSTPGGTNVLSFSLACNRSFKDKNDQWQEAADFVNCVAWGSIAERINKFVAKGKRIFVTGRLQTRSWDKDGQKHYATEVVVSDVVLIDFAEKTETNNVQEPVNDNPIDLSDIPF
jgi:single-strand DNA-binding protein